MKYANEIFFLVFALILWGLLYGSRFLLTFGKPSQSEKLWLIALTLTASSFTLFSLASTISLSLLTLANTCFIANFIYFALFCRSLNGPIPKNAHILIYSGLLVFFAFFEYLRQSELFIERVGLISLIAASCFIWQLLELKRLKEIESTQLRFLIYTTIIELSLTITRFAVLYIDGERSTPNLYQEGALSSSIRWAWLGISILSYVAVLGYWLEKISIEKAQALQNSSKVIALLREKECLIMGLMKANKTAVTGALSASIAHELNQPLGASNINIQFLKSKLEKGQLNPELGKEVLDDLERDNKRAATIVGSLRSIFTESGIKNEEVKVGQIIDSVLEIVNSDLLAKNIQVDLNIDQNLRVHIKDAEFQQVFLNLINNAVQSISSLEAVKGHIQIEATQNEDKAQISISDNGSGVPKEQQLGLFELLNTTKETGMGLGLWLCKHIITRYEGSIYYKDAVGRGAKFVIELPLFNKNKMGLS